MLEEARAEGKKTMLDPPEASRRARWLVDLFFRCARPEWGKRLSHLEIEGYLRMRGYDPAHLYDWMRVADAAAVEWVHERDEVQRKQTLGAARGGRPTRH